jgi:hypothetical protein
VAGYPIGQLVLYEEDFGWMAFRELNPEVLGSLWLMASATWGGGGITLKAFVIGKADRASFKLYAGICLTTEEMHGKLKSG